MNNLIRLIESARDSVPIEPPPIIEWAEENVFFPSSVRSKSFNISITPWLREPIERQTDLETRCTSLRKPIQSGGSVAGEVVAEYWIEFARGFFQYNWSNDKRAEQRWNSRIKSILEACPSIKARMDNLDYSKGEIDFGNVFFRMQGALVSENLDSDSVRLQVNEELHSWEPGHLKKAEGRQTAVWDYKRFNISNAGRKNDQFDEDFWKGTAQFWEVKCPGCGLYHRLRTRWEDNKPELGGLRYDADGCRLEGLYQYDYNKLRPTIAYQMPCGFKVRNSDVITRRKLSTSGRYSEPTNSGAELSHRSYTYEAVAVDFIDWMTLIVEKHDALRARRYGDLEPWIKYTTERECLPYSEDTVPITNIVTTNKGMAKSREGITDRTFRFFSLDRQQGKTSQGEFPYWWMVVRDFKIHTDKLESRLVYEGRPETDDEVLRVMREYECNPWHGVADSGDDTTHVYLFCLKHGINAIKGGREEVYTHENGARRVFSTPRPLHLMLNRDPKFNYVEVDVGGGRVESMPHPYEPMFIIYSKNGIREKLHWLKTYTQFDTPDDVSEDYKNHMDSEERIETKNPQDNSTKFIWYQRKTRNDLFVDECYIALQVDLAGAISVQQ